MKFTLFQHGETGRTTTIEEPLANDFAKNNLRWLRVGNLVMEQQLAASQADNLRLREFAEFAWRDVPMNEYAFKMCEEALATPPGDMTALREWGARTIEEIAESFGIADLELVDVFVEAAKQLREGKWTPWALR